MEKAVIERVRQEKPADYLKVVASLLPKDVNLNVYLPSRGGKTGGTGAVGAAALGEGLIGCPIRA